MSHLPVGGDYVHEHFSSLSETAASVWKAMERKGTAFRAAVRPALHQGVGSAAAAVVCPSIRCKARATPLRMRPILKGRRSACRRAGTASRASGPNLSQVVRRYPADQLIVIGQGFDQGGDNQRALVA